MNTTLPTLLLLALISAAGCTRQWMIPECTPPFKLKSEEPIKLYLIDWVDRSYSYTSFDLPPNDRFLCIQPFDGGDRWCERRAVVREGYSGTPIHTAVTVEALDDGSAIEFDGSIARYQVSGWAAFDSILQHSTHFKGRIGSTTVWLSGVDILHLAREYPPFTSAYSDAFKAIGGEDMLEIYRNHSLNKASQWKCTIDDE